MTRFLFSSAAAALLSGTALAADIPAYEPAPMIAPVPAAYDWTGLYLGLQAGWKFGDDDYTVTGADTSFDIDGWFAGGHIGGRYQWNWLVTGLEADLEWADVEGDFTAGNGDEVGTEINWESSIRGTLGVAFDRVHVYGTGGVAFAGTENRIFDFGTLTEETDDDTRIGWTAGAGVDVAVTQRFTVGVLYKYVDLGEEEYDSVIFPADDFYVRRDVSFGPRPRRADLVDPPR